MELTIPSCISGFRIAMSSDHRGAKIVLIVLFLGMIWAPLLLSVFQIGIQSESNFAFMERRAAQAYPSTPWSINELSAYPGTFERAFNDHFPLRKYGIEYYGRLCVQVLGTAPRSQLLVGKDGHCFLGSHLDDRSYLAALTPIQRDEEKLPYEVEQIESYGEFLESLPVPAVMVSIPTSHVLDFEHLPDFIQRQADPDALAVPQCVKVMQNTPESIRNRFLLCPIERIRKENARYPLYAEKNFHWHPGRYTWLMASSIAEHFGVEQYEEPKSDVFRYESTTSDLLQFASFSMINRNTEVYRPEMWAELGIGDHKLEEAYPNLPPLAHTRYTVNHNRDRCVLVVGESFTPMLNTDLARYFGEVISVNYNVARFEPEARKWLEGVMRDVQPDYVVFLHHQFFHIFEDFMTDYRATQGIGAAVEQIAVEPESSGVRN